MNINSANRKEHNMNTIIFPDNVATVIKSFLDVNNGDKNTQNLILAIGAQLLDISSDTMLDICNKNYAMKIITNEYETNK